MPPRYPVTQLFPEHTRYEPIALEAIQSSILQLGVNYWKALRGSRPYPRRDELDPRKIGRALANMVVARVVDGGADFDVRIVGDEVRRAYPISLNGRLLSEIACDLPTPAARWGQAFRRVVHTALPIAIHVHVGLDNPEVNFSFAEVVCLPLGHGKSAVDHVLTFSEHALEVSS